MTDAERLLALTRTLPKSGQTYYVLFAVLYGLGLRVGEACRLCVKDVDLTRRLLVIRETKFYKYAACLAMPIRRTGNRGDDAKMAIRA